MEHITIIEVILQEEFATMRFDSIWKKSVCRASYWIAVPYCTSSKQAL